MSEETAIQPTETTEHEQKRIESDSLMESVTGITHTKLKALTTFISEILKAVSGTPEFSKLSPLSNPIGHELETIGRFNTAEAESVMMAMTLKDLYTFFEPLQVFATHKSLTSISKDGDGRLEEISYVGATAGMKALEKIGFNISGTEKVKTKGEGRILSGIRGKKDRD